MAPSESRSIVVTGAAGLVGQNLIPRLKARGFGPIVAIDKHLANTAILARLHPDITIVKADLSQPGAWQDSFAGARVLVMGHAQIGALTEEPFIANNVTASRNVLDAAKAHGVGYMVHLSSSVVNSLARDFYTESKKVQEAMVVESGIPACILRPTLMFGWFDRKHLGWLARFMQKTPVFPVPGDGRYLRQPLYAGDFCEIICACIDKPQPGNGYNISGQEKVTYIDMIRQLKEACGARAAIVRIAPNQRGGFLAVRTANAEAVVKKLRDRMVFADARGGIVRLGPAPYISDAQLRDAALAFCESVTTLS